MSTIKTSEEVKQLKEAWVHDPCWDIEHTEGFEAYEEELTSFRLQKEAEWGKQIKEQEEVYAKKIGLTDNLVLAKVIKNLERDLHHVRQLLDELKYKE